MGHDDPTQGPSFLLLQRTLQVPKAKTHLGTIHQKSSENSIVLLLIFGSLWNIFLKYNVVSHQVLS